VNSILIVAIGADAIAKVDLVAILRGKATNEAPAAPAPKLTEALVPSQPPEGGACLDRCAAAEMAALAGKFDGEPLETECPLHKVGPGVPCPTEAPPTIVPEAHTVVPKVGKFLRKISSGKVAEILAHDTERPATCRDKQAAELAALNTLLQAEPRDEEAIKAQRAKVDELAEECEVAREWQIQMVASGNVGWLSDNEIAMGWEECDAPPVATEPAPVVSSPS